MNDGHQNNCHGTGGAGHLKVRPTEGRSDETRDNRRHQPGPRTHARRDTKGEGQRERDDGHRQPGDDVASRIATEGTVVRDRWPESADRASCARAELGHLVPSIESLQSNSRSANIFMSTGVSIFTCTDWAHAEWTGRAGLGG